MRVSSLLISMLSLAIGCGSNEPASLKFVDIVPAQPRLGETLTVHFQALDYRGQPQAGVPVTFELQTEKPGVNLSPRQAVTNKEAGIAETQITATGSVAGIVVVAKAGSKVHVSPSITFAGSVPNARQFTFECGPIGAPASGGVRAIGAYDEARSLIAGIKVECTAHVGDRNSEAVAGALVSFETEAGTINPTSTSIVDQAGNATILYKTSLPLPRDVDPGVFTWSPENGPAHTGELIAPYWMEPWDWRANPIVSYGGPATFQEPRRADPIRPGITLNPRDNLVTMIAVTAGEEAFIDLNQDGTWNPGEPFDDLTEPFVDENDNGTRDPDERIWADANGNGQWDGKNGQWDGSTLIWVQNRLLWTGIPNRRDVEGAEPVFRVIEPTAPLQVGHFGSAPATFLLADPWFNSMAQNSEDDGCKLVTGDNEVVKSAPEIFGGGRALVYPSARLQNFRVTDGHDPQAIPRPEPFTSPLPFVVPLECTTTFSPIDQARVRLSVYSLAGTVL